VAPVLVRGRVSHLIYAHGPRSGCLEDAAAELGTVADAAADALRRVSLARTG